MSTTRRIALVLERFEPARGGTERYAAELVRRLRRRGHDVTVVAARADAAALHGADWHPIRVPAAPRAWRVWAFAQRAAAATTGKFEIVHGLQKSWGQSVFQPHTGSHRGTLEAVRAALPNGLARLVHRLGKACSLKQWVFAAIERRQYAQQPPPVFVAISSLVRTQMIELHGVSPGQIELLPNPVDTDTFRPATGDERAAVRTAVGSTAGPGARIALWVGNAAGLKGLDRALIAYPGAFDELWAVGAGGASAPAGFRHAPAINGKPVRYLGPRQDLPDLYRGADALLLPTAYDPAPLVVLEALASGLPVLTTEACGLADLVRGAGGQVVADRNDSAALAAAAVAVAESGPPSETFRRQLAETHGWDAHCERLEAIYARAAGANRG